MRLLYSLVALLNASAIYAASWGFEDATLTVQGKGAGVGAGLKEKSAVPNPFALIVFLTWPDSIQSLLLPSL